MTVLRATARYDAWWKKQNLTEKLGKKFSRLNKFKILGYQFTWCPIQSLLDSCLLSYSLIFFWNWLTSHQITDFCYLSNISILQYIDRKLALFFRVAMGFVVGVSIMVVWTTDMYQIIILDAEYQLHNINSNNMNRYIERISSLIPLPLWHNSEEGPTI